MAHISAVNVCLLLLKTLLILICSHNHLLTDSYRIPMQTLQNELMSTSEHTTTVLPANSSPISFEEADFDSGSGSGEQMSDDYSEKEEDYDEDKKGQNNSEYQDAAERSRPTEDISFQLTDCNYIYSCGLNQRCVPGNQSTSYLGRCVCKFGYHSLDNVTCTKFTCKTFSDCRLRFGPNNLCTDAHECSCSIQYSVNYKTQTCTEKIFKDECITDLDCRLKYGSSYSCTQSLLRYSCSKDYSISSDDRYKTYSSTTYTSSTVSVPFGKLLYLLFALLFCCAGKSAKDKWSSSSSSSSSQSQATPAATAARQSIHQPTTAQSTAQSSNSARNVDNESTSDGAETDIHLIGFQNVQGEPCLLVLYRANDTDQNISSDHNSSGATEATNDSPPIYENALKESEVVNLREADNKQKVDSQQEEESLPPTYDSVVPVEPQPNYLWLADKKYTNVHK